MLEPRRQELLRVLGVDQYQRRSEAQQSPVVVEQSQPASSVESPAEPVVLPDASPAESSVVTSRPAEPETVVAQKAEPDKSAERPLRLMWWQFEDLLFIEDTEDDVTAPEQSLLQLAKNIASALGRGQGINGELCWPPGGDFKAISQAEFLQHFVRGRSETVEAELKLILTSEPLQEFAANLGVIFRIESLSAMLADPSLKSTTWQSLKTLRHP